MQKKGIGYVDFELIRIYRRYVDMDILNEKDHNDAAFAIEKMKMSDLALILEIYFCEFKKKLNLLIEEEKGKSILKMVTKSIFTNIQIKLTEIMEE